MSTKTETSESAAGPLSPCVQVCTLDAQQVCLGCRRTLAEIAAWAGMTPAERRRIIAELPSRRAD